MAKNNNLKDFVTDIANAIRAKKGTEETINPQDFATEIENLGGSAESGWQPDADMVWAKSVCENDVQEGFTYKVLQMISDGYVYTDIVVPSGGAVKTSDGGYYTANAKHTWNDENARGAQAEGHSGQKLRWLIYYYTSETPSDIVLLTDVMYACFDGVKFGAIFKEKYSLEYFDIINNGNFNGTDATEMFSNCYMLKSICKIDTANVTTMSKMFYSCRTLLNIPLLDTGNVTDMSKMFYWCRCLPTIPLLNTIKVTNTMEMFYGCYSLKSVPLLNTANAENMESMFDDCYSLQSVPELDTGNATNLANLFSGCNLLTTVPPLINTSNATTVAGMFSSCYSLQNVPPLDTSNATAMNSMFSGCSSLKTIYGINTSNATTVANMFSACSSLQNVPSLSIKSGAIMNYMFDGCRMIQTISHINLTDVTKVTHLFRSAVNLEFITMSDIKVSFDIRASTKFSRETLVGLINNLVDLTGGTAQTMTIGATNLAKLTADDIAIATSRNWSIA